MAKLLIDCDKLAIFVILIKLGQLKNFIGNFLIENKIIIRFDELVTKQFALTVKQTVWIQYFKTFKSSQQILNCILIHFSLQKKIQATLRLDEKKSGANKIDSNNQIEKDSITVELSTNPSADKADSKANPQEPLPNILDYSLVGDRAVIFSLDNQVGGLVRALRIFQASINP